MLILLSGSATATSTCVTSAWLVALVILATILVLHGRHHDRHIQAPRADLVSVIERQMLCRSHVGLLILYDAELGFHWMLSHCSYSLMAIIYIAQRS